MIGTDGAERRLGSYHQCYRVDGKLVAIGVLDLLPTCVSAVYFLYHESIHTHNPGKLGALREIALALEGGYRWWYPGYYIHNCPKMRYKIDYSPQYVLDPETLEWDRLDKDALAIFDKQHYVSLSKERSRAADNQGAEEKANGHVKDANLEADGTLSNDGEGEDESYLLCSDMPGIPSLAEMEAVDMDGLLLRSDYADQFFLASDLVVWEKEQVSQFGSLKSRIAELVAAIGPDLMGEVCIDFRKRNKD